MVLVRFDFGSAWFLGRRGGRLPVPAFLSAGLTPCHFLPRHGHAEYVDLGVEVWVGTARQSVSLDEEKGNLDLVLMSQLTASSTARSAHELSGLDPGETQCNWLHIGKYRSIYCHYSSCRVEHGFVKALR